MQPDTNLGRYRIEAFLGKGAFAEVYRALDTALDRVVALKVLKPALLADEDALARFLQETKALASLVHPHIAWVWDVGEAGGRHFIAMRYVDGLPLDRVLAERGPLPWEEALVITQQVAEALQFAHDKGLVHRDVKPQNILVSEREGAVLTDFGLVKAMAASGMTSTGMFLGTPPYMAPEIWKGAAVGPAVDQYALACVLVEMLTGNVLYGGNTPPAVMARHFQPPALPKTWPAGTLPNIEDVLVYALAQDARDRYDNMLQLLDAVTSQPWIFSMGWKAEVWIKPADGGCPDWSLAGHTPGAVSIPAGDEVQLILEPESEAELAGMVEDFASEQRVSYVKLNIPFKAIDSWLTPIRSLTNLRCLSLKLGTVKAAKDDFFASIDMLFKLRLIPNLVLSMVITDAGLAFLSALTNLRCLSLYCGFLTVITDAGLEHLRSLTNLQELKICWGKQITDAGLAYLSVLINLQKLDIKFCVLITDAGLAHLGVLTNLQELGLTWCDGITDIGLAHLGVLTNLQELYLSGCTQIADAGLAHLSALTHLQKLNLSDCKQITDYGFAHLRSLANLQELSLGGEITACMQIGDAGLSHLSALINLQKLNLSKCEQIMDTGLAHLSSLTNLHELVLSGCTQITDAGLAHLSSLTNLQDLDLSHCEQITGAGLAHLVALSHLQELDLSDCDGITDVGLTYLGTLTHLQELNLSRCKQITDASLAHLNSLTNLQNLYLWGCEQITDAGIKLLTQRNLEVHY